MKPIPMNSILNHLASAFFFPALVGFTARCRSTQLKAPLCGETGTGAKTESVP